MGYRVTGVSLPWIGMQWERASGDKEVAQQTIIELENRRVLFGDRHSGDEMYCVNSANEIRHFLTGQISAAKPGKDLANSLRAMRAACRKFVDAAGPNADNFHPGWPENSRFVVSLGELRTLIGVQVARIAAQFDLPIEEELKTIVPPTDEDDLGWVPGFEGSP